MAKQQKAPSARKSATGRSRKNVLSPDSEQSNTATSQRTKGVRRIIVAFLVFCLKFTLVAAVLGSFGLIWLDVQITEKFEGKRWALPAHVYARPLELYVGQSLTADQLQRELQGLGYRQVEQVKGPGQWAKMGKQIRFHSRGFAFPDGQEAAQQLSVSFAQGQVNQLKRADGLDVPLMRLEPIRIGGIYPDNNEDRDLIRLSQAPDYLVQALIQVEDRDFYQHHGVSLKGIARAMWVNLQAGRFIQGGSTLTQQLIKNFYLTSERALSRKLLELPMAMLLELHYSKDEILEAYLNEVYLGQSGRRAIHGFGLAAQYYFATPVSELQLHQAALLAAMVKGPSWYDPRRNPQRALTRRNLVLRILAQQGIITQQQLSEALAKPLGIVKQRSLHKGAYPAYLDLVKRQLQDEYPQDVLSSDGLRVFTALDPQAQYQAEQAVGKTLNVLEQRYPQQHDQLQGSMVVTDPQTGEVLALIGGRTARYRGFNRALDMRRPIGSLIKPPLYLAALEQGYTLASLLDDSPLNLAQEDGTVWQPQNFDRTSHGTVPLYQSLMRSYNLSTVRLGLDVGVDTLRTMLQRLGVEQPVPPYPSLFLGAANLSPMAVAQLYQTIAASGFRIPLRAIRQVTGADNQVLSRYPYQVEQQVSPANSWLLQFALQQTARFGTARGLYRSLPADLNIAAKTGTSDDQRDSWFAGFTGNRLAVVWVGRDDNEPLSFTGSSGALHAWAALIKTQPQQGFYAGRPENVQYRWVDPTSGKLSQSTCATAVQLPFRAGTEPVEFTPCDQQAVQTPPAVEPDAVETPQPLKALKSWLRSLF